MKVEFTRTSHESAVLDDNELERIVIEVLRDVYDMPPYSFIKDDKVMVEIEYAGSHTWWDNKELRKATKRDKRALKVIEEVREHFNTDES